MRDGVNPFTILSFWLVNSVSLDDYGESFGWGSLWPVGLQVIEPEQLQLRPEVLVINGNRNANHLRDASSSKQKGMFLEKSSPVIQHFKISINLFILVTLANQHPSRSLLPG